ncbi:MAG: hypothetical protein V3S11_01545 [Elusimicrobiota bacterium]
MAACKYCGCSSWFFALSSEKLCAACEPLVKMDVEQRRQLVEDSAKAAEQTLNPHSKIIRMKSIVENLDVLADYEKKGIETLKGKAGSRQKHTQENLDALILQTARAELDETLTAVRKKKAPEAKIKLLSAFLVKLEEYKDHPQHREKIRILEKKVRNTTYRIQLSSHLEHARRAEKAGETELALKNYRDALNYLKSTDDDSEEKAGHLQSIESKLKALSKPS